MQKMKHSKFTSFFIFALIASPLLFAVKLRDFSKHEATQHLRSLWIYANEYAAEHEEKYPNKIEDLNELIKEDKNLITFVNSPNFEYLASEKGTWDNTEELTMFRYLFPEKGFLSLNGWGKVIWKEMKEEHIQSSHTTSASAPH